MNERGAMKAINLVELAGLFRAAVSTDPTVPAVSAVSPVDDAHDGAAEFARVDGVLAALLATPEDERMLRLPLYDTDMVDFEIPQAEALRADALRADALRADAPRAEASRAEAPYAEEAGPR